MERENKIGDLPNYDWMQNIISDHVKKMAATMEDIVKESLSEYHKLPLTEETYKRVNRVEIEDEPGVTYYFLDSADIQNFNDYDWRNLVCKIVIPRPWEGINNDDIGTYKMTFFFETPVENSKFTQL